MIKTTLNNQTRIFAKLPFAELVTQVKQVYSLPEEWKFTASYTDEDGDVITIDSEGEYQRLIEALNEKTLRLSIQGEETQENVIPFFFDGMRMKRAPRWNSRAPVLVSF